MKSHLYKKDIDAIVDRLLTQNPCPSHRYSKEEIDSLLSEEYSKGQLERIYFRYIYKLEHTATANFVPLSACNFRFH